MGQLTQIQLDKGDPIQNSIDEENWRKSLPKGYLKNTVKYEKMNHERSMARQIQIDYSMKEMSSTSYNFGTQRSRSIANNNINASPFKNKESGRGSLAPTGSSAAKFFLTTERSFPKKSSKVSNKYVDSGKL